MNEELWSEFYNEACNALQENNLDLAEANWRRAWSQVRDLDKSDGRYLMTLEYFCDLLCQRQKLKEAEPLMLDLVAAKEQVFGADDLKTGITHNALAGLYYASKNFDKAEEHCERALAIHRGALGEEHPDVLLIIQNLAMLYHARQAYDKAEPFYEEAIKLAEKIHGPQSTLTMDINENYMALLNITGQKKKMRKVKKTLILPVLERLIQVVGEDSKQPVTTNKGFPGSTLTGLKRDPRRSNQCLYRITPLPTPDRKE